MRRRKIDSKTERMLLEGLITSREFLSQAAPILQAELLSLRDLPLFFQIADWCLVFWEEYSRAPRRHIEAVFHSWSDTAQDEELVDSIHDLLEDLSDQYEDDGDDISVPYLVDLLGEFLTKHKLKKLQETLDSSLSQGETKAAAEAVQAYRTIEVGQGAGVDPLNDDAVWERTFAEPNASLIHFEGDAGTFFNTAFTRDSLVAIQAPEKRGKTWWMIEMTVRSLMRKRKVAVFEVGDLSEAQFMMRLGVRWANLPMRKEFCGEIKWITKIEVDEDEENGCRTEENLEEYPKPVTKKQVKVGRDRFKRAHGLSSKRSYCEVSVHANSSINVKGIEAILERWRSEKDFVPDVIVIDYADILAPETERKEGRDMINETWQALRRLSQDWHCLVLTATQANAKSYDAQTQGMGNFSNDKRKFAHVTGIFALNQTPEEKEAQVMRLNWIVLRESPFNTKRCLYVGNCFALGRAMTCAAFKHGKRKKED